MLTSPVEELLQTLNRIDLYLTNQPNGPCAASFKKMRVEVIALLQKYK